MILGLRLKWHKKNDGKKANESALDISDLDPNVGKWILAKLKAFMDGAKVPDTWPQFHHNAGFL